MYPLMRDQNVVSKVDILKLVTSYLFASLLFLVVPFFNKKLIDFAAEAGVAISSLQMLGIIAITFVIQLCIFYFGNYLNAKYAGYIDRNIKRFLFKKLLDMPPADYNVLDKGMVTNLFFSDSGNASRAILNYRVFVVTSSLQIVIVMGLMLSINRRLAIIAFCFMPFYLISVNLNVKKIASANRAQISAQDFFVADVKNYVSSKDHMNATHTEAYFNARYDKTVTDWIDKRIRYNFWFILIRRVPVFISTVAPLVMLWSGAVAVHSGKLSLGTLVMFSQYTGFLFEPLTNLSQIVTEKKAFQPYFERLEAFLYKVTDSAERYDAFFQTSDVFLKASGVEVYTPKGELLYEANIRIPKKGFYIVKGANGSGKSTLFKMIMGQLSGAQMQMHSGGYFAIDEHFKSDIAILNYPLFAFRGTVKENICLDRANSEAQLSKMETLLHLPPLEKQVTIDPPNLSSGEGQKIALARTLMMATACVLLDEPTTNLEKETVAALKTYIQSEKSNRLLIAVMHDDGFDALADGLWHIANGKIEAQT